MNNTENRVNHIISGKNALWQYNCVTFHEESNYVS